MNLFYVHPDDIHGELIKIRDQELKHAVKVLRLKAGDQINVTDGEGTLYRCEIISIAKHRADLRVLDSKKDSRELPELVLCIGILKKRDRLEFAVEKAVELGVNKVVVFRGDHSEKQNVRLERLENTVLSAMKQSLRYYLPEVEIEESLQSALAKTGNGTAIILADQETTSQKIPGKFSSYFLVVGPEGGFSSDETDILKSFDTISYSLGSKRLRTETAAITLTDRFRNAK